jgi:hypothetical protein
LSRSRASVRRLGVAALATLTTFGALTLAAGSAVAAAQTRYVATTGDDGNVDSNNDCLVATNPCKTIQHGVDEAAGGDTVSVAAGTYAESVFISKSLTIVGSTSGTTAVTGDSEGDPSIDIEPQGDSGPPTVTLQHLSAVHNSDAPGIVAFGANVNIADSVASDDVEAGLLFLGGELTVTNSTFAGNTTSSSGSGLGDGTGALVVIASASFDSSTFADNDSAGITMIGGGPTLTAAALNADVQGPATTTVEVRNSTVSGNGAGGVVNFAGALAADTSTFANNTGGGVVALSGHTEVTSSTIAGTTPFPGDLGPEQGGIVAVSDAGTPGLSLNRTQKASLTRLLSEHRSAIAKAARKLATVAPVIEPVLSVAGSIVAKNSSLPDCFGDVIDNGYNASSDAANSCKFSAAKHDLVKTDPKLGALANNGGPTRTELLHKGSPAIDAISTGNAGCVADATDQRGIARPQPTGGACDIGAVEVAQLPIVISPDRLPHGTVGKPYDQTITATGGLGEPYVWSLGAGELPPGLSFSAGGVIGGTPTKAGTYKVTVSVDDPVRKQYTIVIEAPAAPNDNGNEPIANTGANVAPLATLGGGALVAGLLLLVGAGALGRRPGRHRAG